MFRRKRTDEMELRLEAARERNTEAFHENAKASKDLHDFLRSFGDRAERTNRELIAQPKDLRHESQAQRDALLKVVDRMDRFDPGGAGAG